MSKRPSLRRRLIVGLLVYVAILSAVLAFHGYWVNERSEQAVWESFLRSEMQYFTEKRARDPVHFSPNTEKLRFYDVSDPKPHVFERLPPGVHDELRVGDREYVLMLEPAQDGSGTRVLILDITDQEQDEMKLGATLWVSVLLVAGLLSALIFWGVDRLVRPLTQLAKAIPRLNPDGHGGALAVNDSTPSEVALVADALNGYTDRIREYVDREKEFINLASHELRTPIAVITASMQIALAHEETPDTVRPYLERAHRTSVEMTELSNMLLALARDPERIRKEARAVDIAEELPDILEDHAFVADNKELAIRSQIDGPLVVEAPPQVLRAVIGNLLRNAIENSDRGVIAISASGASTLVIQDPGHGMSGEEMSALYTRLTRNGVVRSAGIGLGLISRICQHFDWHLELSSGMEGGTIARVTFGSPDRRRSS